MRKGVGLNNLSEVVTQQCPEWESSDALPLRPVPQWCRLW